MMNPKDYLTTNTWVIQKPDEILEDLNKFVEILNKEPPNIDRSYFVPRDLCDVTTNLKDKGESELGKKVILHLCADLGSDSFPYSIDENYEVIKVGEKEGVEDFKPPANVWGVIANPPCTEYSTANNNNRLIDPNTSVLEHCQRIIKECNPKWWIIENPATGSMKEILGKPTFIYQPWQYGSPWTKRTALWGTFMIPPVIYKKWEDVPKNPDLYVRPGRPKCSLAFLHKSAIQYIEEFKVFIPYVKNDADFRSLCSQGFAEAFKKANP